MRFHLLLYVFFVCCQNAIYAQINTEKNKTAFLLTDVDSDIEYPAKMLELLIPTGGLKVQGIMYQASGKELHPTVLMLHGFPGNEKNLDLAQALRSKGWNVIYFNYRGAWGNPGSFSLMNCVEDAVNAVEYLISHAEEFRIDVNRISLLGHSMGGWVTLKSIQHLPSIDKAIVLSTWNIASDFAHLNTQEDIIANAIEELSNVFVLNTSYKDIFYPVVKNISDYQLITDSKRLANKDLLFIDEHNNNKEIVDNIKNHNPNAATYLIWESDHSFSNKRASLINQIIEFLSIQ
jgi:uncharacterized protein